MRFSSATTVALALANSATSVETKDRQAKGFGFHKPNQRGRRALTNGETISYSGKQASGYARKVQKKLVRKKQHDLTSGYRPLWSGHDAGDYKYKEYDMKKGEPDIGILSFNENQQRSANVNPLWANDSTETFSDLDEALPSFAECGPDVGILSCGDGFACKEGVCVSTKRDLQLGSCPPPDIDPGFDCDCTGFDGATGTGEVICTNINGCFEDSTACGFLSKAYDYIGNYTYTRFNSVLSIENSAGATFGYYVLDSEITSCFAYVNENACNCTVGDCSGAANSFNEAVSADCAYLPTIDFCASNQDPVVTLFEYAGQSNSTYGFAATCPPEPDDNCDCTDFDNETGLGSFSCTETPVPGFDSGTRIISYNFTTLTDYTYSIISAVGEDSYQIGYNEVYGELVNCFAFADDCECECVVGDCGDEDGPSVFAVNCPGIDPVDACALDDPAQVLFDLDPVCSAEITAAPITTPVDSTNTIAPTTTPIDASNTAAPTTTPIDATNTAALTTTPVDSTNPVAPTATPVDDTNTATPTATPVDGMTTATPTTTPVDGATTAAPTTIPVDGTTTAAPTTTPVESTTAAPTAEDDTSTSTASALEFQQLVPAIAIIGMFVQLVVG